MRVLHVVSGELLDSAGSYAMTQAPNCKPRQAKCGLRCAIKLVPKAEGPRDLFPQERRKLLRPDASIALFDRRLAEANAVCTRTGVQ